MSTFFQLVFTIAGAGVHDGCKVGVEKRVNTNTDVDTDVDNKNQTLLNINIVASYTGKEWSFLDLLSHPVPFTLDAVRTTIKNEFIRMMYNNSLMKRRKSHTAPLSRVQRSLDEDEDEEDYEEETDDHTEAIEPDFGLWIHLGT